MSATSSATASQAATHGLDKTFFMPPSSIMPSLKAGASLQKLSGANNYHTARLPYDLSRYLTYPDILTTRRLSKALNHTYSIIEMLGNTTEQDRDAMAKRLESLERSPDFPAKLEAAYKAFTSTHWDVSNPIFADSDFDLYVWRAFTQGIIKKMQIVTAHIFHFASQSPENEYMHAGAKATTVACFNDKLELNKDAQQIESTFSNAAGDFMTPAQRKEFWESVKKLPLSERQFLQIPTKGTFNKTIIGRIADIDYSLLMCHKKPGRKFTIDLGGYSMVGTSPTEYMLAVPSFGMKDAFIRNKFGNQARRMNAVFGIATGTDMRRNAFQGLQDLAISSRWFPTPELADDYPSPSVLYTLHDFYHDLSSSGMPKHLAIFIVHIIFHLERKRNEELASLKKEKAEDSEIGAKRLVNKLSFVPLIKKMTDYEPSDFRDDSHKNRTIDAQFWAVLSRLIQSGLKDSGKEFFKSAKFTSLCNHCDKLHNPAEAVIDTKFKDSTKAKIIGHVVDYVFKQGHGARVGVTLEGLKEQLNFLNSNPGNVGLEIIKDLIAAAEKLSAPTGQTPTAATTNSATFAIDGQKMECYVQ